MDWFRTHPYTFFVAIAALLLIVGVFAFKGEPQDSSNPSTIAWGGLGGGFLYPNSPTRSGDNTISSSTIYTEIQSSPPFSYTPYSPSNTANQTEDGFNMDAFLDFLRTDTKSDSSTSFQSSFNWEDYSFLPTGPISLGNSTKERTPIQEALHEYGNEAGAFVQSFENANRDMAEVVQKQADKPKDPTAISNLIKLADALSGVGNSLEKIENVPSEAVSANTSLAASYKNMGIKLALVPKAETDEERISSMLAYNAAAEEFVRRYVAMVTLFSVSEVTFTSDEPGSVFTFTGVSF